MPREVVVFLLGLSLLACWLMVDRAWEGRTRVWRSVLTIIAALVLVVPIGNYIDNDIWLAGMFLLGASTGTALAVIAARVS
jgi:hypothetical protein